jgi:uncharacterized phage-associated protein
VNRKAASHVNRLKYRQLLHYVCTRVGGLPHVGKTVLFKLLYFMEFDYYEIHEEPLVGETFRRIPKGPAPCHFDGVLADLTASGGVKAVQTQFHGHRQYKYIALTEPALDKLTSDELRFVDRELQRLASMNATQISDHSHRDVPYVATKDGELIDPELVFYREPAYSVREYPPDED